VVLVLVGGVAWAAEDDAREPDPGVVQPRDVHVQRQMDQWVLEPVATATTSSCPTASSGASRISSRICASGQHDERVPAGKPANGASDLTRFVVNTTIGVRGFFDFATSLRLSSVTTRTSDRRSPLGRAVGPIRRVAGVRPVDRARHGRCGVDAAMMIMPFFLESYVTIGARVFEVVNARSLVREDVENARSAALDFYTFVRNAYLQRRAILIRDEKDTTRDVNDRLYFPDAEPPAN
jgi:phospholipid-binding lipoprotein MlaA